MGQKIISRSIFYISGLNGERTKNCHRSLNWRVCDPSGWFLQHQAAARALSGSCQHQRQSHKTQRSAKFIAIILHTHQRKMLIFNRSTFGLIAPSSSRVLTLRWKLKLPLLKCRTKGAIQRKNAFPANYAIDKVYKNNDSWNYFFIYDKFLNFFIRRNFGRLLWFMFANSILF